MDILSSLMDGFATALTPMNLLYALIGVLLGTAVGVLPGIGPAMTVALLLPVTYGPRTDQRLHHVRRHLLRRHVRRVHHVDPAQHPRRIVLGDHRDRGQPMAKAGRAAQALATAAIGSFVAGTIGTALLVVFAPIVVQFAVSLGSPELLRHHGPGPARGHRRPRARPGCAASPPSASAWRSASSASTSSPASSGSPSACRCSPTASTSSSSRWRSSPSARPCGSPRTCAARPLQIIPVGRPWMGKEDWKRSWKPWLRGTAFGFPFGALPAGGAEIPTFLSYVTEKRLSKHPEEFGKGAIEGVAGPEAANNAVGRGHPGADAGARPADERHRRRHARRVHPVTASSPARCCSTRSRTLVWALIASLFIGNFLLLRAQPAAGTGLGEAAADPAPLPLRGHPLLRHAGRLRGQPAGVRPGASCWSSARSAS